MKISISDLKTLEQASQELGKGFSAKTLKRWIDSGKLKEGIHYFDCRRPGCRRGKYRIHLENFLGFLERPAGKR